MSIPIIYILFGTFAAAIFFIEIVLFFIGLPSTLEFDLDMSYDPNPSFFDTIFESIGLGIIPTSLFLSMFSLTFSVVGSLFYLMMPGTIFATLPLSIPFSFAAAILVVSLITKTLKKLMHVVPTSITNIKELSGQTAIIAFGEASSTLATEANVKDQYGKTHVVLVRTHADNMYFSKNEHVKLLDYLPEEGYFLATKLNKEY